MEVGPVVLQNFKAKKTRERRVTVVKAVESEDHNIEDKVVDESVEDESEDLKVTNRIVVNQRGSHFLNGS